MDKRIEALKNIWADISEEKQNSKFETQQDNNDIIIENCDIPEFIGNPLSKELKKEKSYNYVQKTQCDYVPPKRRYKSARKSGQLYT